MYATVDDLRDEGVTEAQASGDRLGGLYDKAGDLVQAVRTPPGLYVTEARPSGFGLNMARPRRNLLMVTFEDRQPAAGRSA